MTDITAEQAKEIAENLIGTCAIDIVPIIVGSVLSAVMTGIVLSFYYVFKIIWKLMEKRF